MGGWAGAFISTFLVQTQMGTPSVLPTALVNVLATSTVFLQCVSSGTDTAVRAWQVDTLPLTLFLQALIYIYTLLPESL